MFAGEQRDWTLPTFGEFCPSAIDWARLAAYIDGEGSILINTQKRGGPEAWGFFLRVTVANTDIRLMVWLKDTFGGTYKDANTAAYYVGKNWKKSYHWGASSHRGAWLLHNCLPYFIMKREQAEIGIQLQTSLSAGIKARGVRVPDTVREHRRGLKQRLLTLKTRGIGVTSEPSEPVSEAS